MPRPWWAVFHVPDANRDYTQVLSTEVVAHSRKNHFYLYPVVDGVSMAPGALYFNVA